MIGQKDLFPEMVLAGIKEALVVENRDPKAQERVLVRVLGVHNMDTDEIGNAIWAKHCAPTRNSSGDLPEKGDWVYVLFPDKSDPMNCLWLGFVRSSYQYNVDDERVSDKNQKIYLIKMGVTLDKIEQVKAYTNKDFYTTTENLDEYRVLTPDEITKLKQIERQSMEEAARRKSIEITGQMD